MSSSQTTQKWHTYFNGLLAKFNPDGTIIGKTFKEMKQGKGFTTAEVDSSVISYRIGDEKTTSSIERTVSIAQFVVNELYEKDRCREYFVLSISIGSSNGYNKLTETADIQSSFDQYVSQLHKDITNDPIDYHFDVICSAITTSSTIKVLHITAASSNVSNKTIDRLCDIVTQSMTIESVKIDPYLSHDHMALLVNAVCNNPRVKANPKAISLDISPLYTNKEWISSMNNSMTATHCELARIAQLQLTKAEQDSQYEKAMKEAEMIVAKMEADKVREARRLAQEAEEMEAAMNKAEHEYIARQSGYRKSVQASKDYSAEIEALKANRDAEIKREAKKLSESWIQSNSLVGARPSSQPASQQVNQPSFLSQLESYTYKTDKNIIARDASTYMAALKQSNSVPQQVVSPQAVSPQVMSPQVAPQVVTPAPAKREPDVCPYYNRSECAQYHLIGASCPVHYP